MRLNIRKHYSKIFKKQIKSNESWTLVDRTSARSLGSDFQDIYLSKNKKQYKFVYISERTDEDGIVEEIINEVIYYSLDSGKKHREDGPAHIKYYYGELEKEEYYWQGIKHREGGPAEIVYDVYDNGNIIKEKWIQNNKIHREDGPAAIYYYPNGNIETEEYFVNDNLHREDGPAIISYYPNGNLWRVRYYKNNRFYRADGPIEIRYDENGNIEYSF
jgi:antitoxin component YwqK of YwqJK toxin-antitoxin module